jgi:Glycosyl transferases group 1
MNVVLIVPSRSASGGLKMTCIGAKALLARGHTVRILYRRSSLKGSCKLMYGRLLGSQDWLDHFPGEVTSFGDIRKCRFEEDEIIVGVGMAMSYELRHLKRLENVKIQYLRGATPWMPELMRKALSIPLPKIVVASYLKDIVEEQGEGKVLAVVHNGVDPANYFSSVPESERDGVGTVYSSHPAKDPETILKVVSRLRSERPTLRIRAFGGDPRPAQFLSGSYRRYPDAATAREIYSRSLVWLMVSRSEGLPNPVLEAMACGCAVVATDCGGSRDIISDGVDGFLVPVGDCAAILERTQQLLDDAPLRNRITNRARETVRSFSVDSYIADLEAALEQVVDSSRCCGSNDHRTEPVGGMGWTGDPARSFRGHTNP